MPTVLTLATRKRLLPTAADPEVREVMSQRLSRLAGVDGAHLAPLRQVREVADGFVLVHDEPQDAVPLSSLPPDGSTSEVLALGLALVQSLAALHGAGLAHGAVGPDAVLLGPGAAVTLTAAGTGWDAEPARVADDVAGLARLLLDRLDTGSIGSPLALLLVRAVDPDPTVRPRLAQLGEALERAARPEPPRPLPRESVADRPAVALGSGAPQPPTSTSGPPSAAARRHARTSTHPGPRARLARVRWPVLADVPWRGVVLLVVWCVGVVLLVQGAVGLWRTRAVSTTSSSAPTAPVSSPTGKVASVDWHEVVTRLDAGRRAAIESGSTAKLAEVVDPEGPAYANDVATLQARARAGLVLVGADVTVTGVRILEEAPVRVVLEVTDTRDRWELRDSQGSVVAAGEPRGPQSWRVVLVADGPRWRYEVVALRESNDTPQAGDTVRE